MKVYALIDYVLATDLQIFVFERIKESIASANLTVEFWGNMLPICFGSSLRRRMKTCEGIFRKEFVLELSHGDLIL